MTTQNNDLDGFPAYSHQSKSQWWGCDSNDNCWGFVTGGFPPLNIMMMTMMIKKRRTTEINAFHCRFPPLKITIVTKC